MSGATAMSISSRINAARCPRVVPAVLVAMAFVVVSVTAAVVPVIPVVIIPVPAVVLVTRPVVVPAVLVPVSARLWCGAPGYPGYGMPPRCSIHKASCWRSV